MDAKFAECNPAKMAARRNLLDQVYLPVQKETSRPFPATFVLLVSLDAITCPVLIIGSVNDKLVRLDDLHEMNNRFRDSRLKVLKGPGHMIPLEAPKELGNEINSFYRARGFL
ncbi:alpha/beta fold hydrolase [Trinickia acidisoli]|uniref:alpha/beta fold hydrolase n=1 Tax=Trinickia acidisoli TaxID=2767482 RepID=UPI001A8D3529|nr:alpha/beta hydrolase [Trinickia acidisoli]